MSVPGDFEDRAEEAVEESPSRYADAPPGDLVHYDGQWVAVRDGEVIANADDEKTLRSNPDVRPGDLVYPIGEPPSGFYLINV
jgi:hypothetical protein